LVLDGIRLDESDLFPNILAKETRFQASITHEGIIGGRVQWKNC
jgi:hypothetical protein